MDVGSVPRHVPISRSTMKGPVGLVPSGGLQMSAQSVMPRSRQRPLRIGISAALVVGILVSLVTRVVSAVKQARNAAHSAATT
jgi:hypothetical protein